MKIPPTRIYIPPEDKESILENIKDVLDSSILTEGKFCKKLEDELTKYLGCKHVVVTNSGTGALECMIRANKTQGEIIVPTETFSATIYSIIRAGCKPIFADVGSDMLLSAESVKLRITDKTVGVMFVHIGGFMSDSVVEISEICSKNGFLLFEDAAQAMGSKYDGKSPGRFGRSAGFSLFPTKVMGSAEGGFITTDDSDLSQLARVLKDQGKTQGNYCAVQGYNWRMSEIQAIIGLTQLHRLSEFIDNRDRIAKFYDEAVNELSSFLDFYPRSKHCSPNWYKYIAYLKKGDRDELKRRLKESEISLSGEVYEVPCHLQEAFSDYTRGSNSYPSAEDLCLRHICFPLTSNMTNEQSIYFTETLKRYFH